MDKEEFWKGYGRFALSEFVVYDDFDFDYVVFGFCVLDGYRAELYDFGSWFGYYDYFGYGFDYFVFFIGFECWID